MFTRITFAMCVLLGSCAIHAESPAPFWENLNPGPYPVGFRTFSEFDTGRTWNETRDHLGRFTADVLGRPVLINVWYPSTSRSRKSAMTFSDYLQQPAPPEFQVLAALLAQRNVQNLEHAVPEPQRNDLRALRVHANAGTPFARGRYPAVLYFGGLNADINANFFLGELLASHGYVVASLSLVGASDRALPQSRDANGIELAVRDMEFALGMLTRLTNADRTRVISMGHSFGAITALIFANRNQNVVATVTLDGTHGFAGGAPLLMKAFNFAPQHFRAPILDLHRAEGEQDARVDATATATLRHAARTLVTLPHAHHSDFTAFALLADKFALPAHPRYANTGWNRGTGRQAYETMCAMVVAFLDEQVLQRSDAAAGFHSAAARGAATVKSLAALPPPLSPDEAIAIAARSDADEPKTWLRACAGEAALANCVDAPRFNNAGYERLGQNQPREALLLFEIVAWAHPKSANAQDSLADALLALGERQRAREAILRSVELAASDPTLDSVERSSFIAAGKRRLEE